jgi:hypothetical protein
MGAASLAGIYRAAEKNKAQHALARFLENTEYSFIFIYPIFEMLSSIPD